MLLEVSVLSPQRLIFKGEAKNLILPGEEGVFEILPLHKNIISRLVSGKLVIDGKVYPLKRGIVKSEKNKVTIIAEE